MVGNQSSKHKELYSDNENDIKKDELKWCPVSLLEVINAGKRLEATVFDIDGRYARNLILNSKFKLKTVTGVNGVADAYHRPRFKRIWVETSDFPIYQPSAILDIMPKPDGYISDKTNTDIESLRVKKGQILLTCSGTVGKTAIVSKTLNNKIFSHDLIRITCKNDIDIGYLYAYLNTNVGSKILETNNYGSVITHIEPEHLVNMPVPYPPKLIRKKINDLIIRSFELRDESNDLIEQATNLLIKELCLPPIKDFETEIFDKKTEINTFLVKLSELNERLDASYHVPIVKAIINHLKAYAAEVTTVGNQKISKKIFLPGRFKRIYVEKGQGKIFFGGKQLYELDPSNKKYLSVLKHNSRIKNELTLKENTILITRSGTIGKVTMTPKHWENWIANEHIIRILPSSNDIAGYLWIFLGSDYGYLLIDRFTYGSVVDEIDDNHVAKIPIPLLKNVDTQYNINDLALKANAKRYEAYKLEQKAIEIMNTEVIFAK